MQDIKDRSLDCSVIPTVALDRVTGGGAWDAKVAATKKTLAPLFAKPTPELKEVICGLGALKEGSKLKDDSGKVLTQAERVEAAKGIRELCKMSPDLPLDEILP